MKILTMRAKLTCKHVTGLVRQDNIQDYVHISGSALLVQGDPEFKRIDFCPNIGLNIKPCLLSLVVEKGYSSFIHISGRPVCLDILVGLTDGTVPGTVEYQVRDPGQHFVSAVA